jgi:hypothetical protein
MKVGLIIIVVSVIWYFVHIELNYRYTRKNNPDSIETKNKQRGHRPEGVEVEVVMREIPAWLMLLGLPPIPLFFIGLIITVIGFLVNLFSN